MIAGIEPHYALVLTRPDIIDAARALVEWAERDDSRRPPSPHQMKALLDDFAAKESANITVRSHARSHTTSRSHRSPLNPPKAANAAAAIMSGGLGRVEREEDLSGRLITEKEREVPADVQPPKTPTSKPQESRGFWSSMSVVTSIFASPLHFFDSRRNQQDSPSAATNKTSETGESKTTLATDPQTPSRPNTRPRPSQSERRTRAQSARTRRPQTERSRRHEDMTKPPIHLRGVISPARVAEIHRQQDRMADARNKKRRAVVEGEETDSESEKASMAIARVGEKRKRPRGTVRTPPAGPPGTFRVPSPGSSDDSSDGESEAEQPTERTRYSAIPVTPRKDLISDDAGDASPFTSIAASQNGPAWKVPEGYKPTYKEAPSPGRRKVTPAAAKTSPKKTSPRKSSPKSTASPPKKSPSPTKKGASPTKKAPSPTKKQVPQDAATSSESEGSFKFPVSDSGSDGDEEDVTGGVSENENQPLQSKQWTQTPPPKPRPSNAQLPQLSSQVAAAEAAKARAEKFKPKQPSSLRNVTQMSPMQIEKENMLLRNQFTSNASFAKLLEGSGVSLAEWERVDALQDEFFRNADPEVLAAVSALPDDMIADYPMPPFLSASAAKSEVEKVVEGLLR